MSMHQWQERDRPSRLEKRYEFDSYEALRDFLDRAASLSEEKNLYPDIGFTRTHVNITIHTDEGKEALSDRQREFASLLDALNTEKQL